MRCAYGCNREGKFKQSNGKQCCSPHYNSCPELRKKNSKGLKRAYKEGRKDCSHFDGKRDWAKGKTAHSDSRINVSSNPRARTLINWLLKSGVKYECSCCGITEWQGKKLTLELDHINGNKNDNRLENLRFLCPNCHSLTPTWRGRNVNGQKKVSDEKLIQALDETDNIRQALIKVGLTPKGGNYKRCYSLLYDVKQ